jgi:hypothetical protein
VFRCLSIFALKHSFCVSTKYFGIQLWRIERVEGGWVGVCSVSIASLCVGRSRVHPPHKMDCPRFPSGFAIYPLHCIRTASSWGNPLRALHVLRLI